MIAGLHEHESLLMEDHVEGLEEEEKMVMEEFLRREMHPRFFCESS